MENFESTEFIKEQTTSQSFPFNIAGIPLNVTTKAKVSLKLRFRGDVVVTPTELAMPQVRVSVGPEADLAATAEASIGAGIDGLAEVSVGASGTLRVGTVALKAEATTFPTRVNERQTTRSGISRIVTRNGGRVEAGIVASTRSMSGKLKVFAELEVGIPFTDLRKTFRQSKTIANFPATSAVSVPVLPPIGFTWF